MAHKVRLFDRHWHLPKSRPIRIGLGIVLIACGLLGFLPVLGFWMLPLGLPRAVGRHPDRAALAPPDHGLVAPPESRGCAGRFRRLGIQARDKVTTCRRIVAPDQERNEASPDNSHSSDDCQLPLWLSGITVIGTASDRGWPWVAYREPPWRSWCRARRSSSLSLVHRALPSAAQRLHVRQPMRCSSRLSISMSSCPH